MSDLFSNKRFLSKPGIQFDFGEKKWGVLFLNRGGPESADEVEEYLYNLYSDPNVKDRPLSILLQKPLAKILSSKSSEKIARQYDEIGGSPLLRWTRLIASNVRRDLGKKYPQADIFAGMRYSEPTIPEELDAAIDEGCRHIILFSMYPHFSEATTGAILEPVGEWLKDFEGELTVSLIDRWSERAEYIKLLRKHIEDAMENIDLKKPYKLLFIAHGATQDMIDSNDNYLTNLSQTAESVGDGYDFSLTFQPHNENDDIVEPDAGKIIRELAQQNIEQIVIAPISFVSDHFGTLYNIDIQLSQIAAEAGIKTFIRTESFNDNVSLAAFIGDLIEEKIDSK
ncbi:MAG: ferrochelatase [candidate division Zixibacteria bacterium]|nr:ferrochelatase [candidate division Zixibacteria bacterium]